MSQDSAFMVAALSGIGGIFLFCYVLARVPRHVREFWKERGERAVRRPGAG
jgi:hypothetical protein